MKRLLLSLFAISLVAGNVFCEDKTPKELAQAAVTEKTEAIKNERKKIKGQGKAKLEKAVKDAEKAVTDAGEGATEDQNKAVTDAKKAVEVFDAATEAIKTMQAELALLEAKLVVETGKEYKNLLKDYNTKKAALKTATDKQTAADKALKALAADTDKTTAQAAFNEAKTAADEAKTAADEATKAVTVTAKEYAKLLLPEYNKTMVPALKATDIDALEIGNLQNLINRMEQEINANKPSFLSSAYGKVSSFVKDVHNFGQTEDGKFSWKRPNMNLFSFVNAADVALVAGALGLGYWQRNLVTRYVKQAPVAFKKASLASKIQLHRGLAWAAAKTA